MSLIFTSLIWSGRHHHAPTNLQPTPHGYKPLLKYVNNRLGRKTHRSCCIVCISFQIIPLLNCITCSYLFSKRLLGLNNYWSSMLSPNNYRMKKDLVFVGFPDVLISYLLYPFVFCCENLCLLSNSVFYVLLYFMLAYTVNNSICVHFPLSYSYCTCLHLF